MPPGDIPARDRPDPSIPPTERIAEGTEVLEAERLGVWARVLTQDGRELWVDSRRLIPLDADEGMTGSFPQPEQEAISVVATNPPAIPVAGPPATAVEADPTSPPSDGPGDRPPRRKWRSRPWAVAVAAIVLVTVIGAVVLAVVGNANSTYVKDPPTVIKGWIDLGFEPVSVLPWAPFDAYVFGEDRVLGIRPTREEPAKVTSLQGSTFGLGGGLNPRGVAEGTIGEIVILDGSDRLIAVDTLFPYGQKEMSLSADVAPLIVDGSGLFADVVVLFELEGQLATKMLVHDAETLKLVGEYSLPNAVNVAAVETWVSDLYVGHTEGLMVLEARDLDEAAPSLKRSFVFPTVALAQGWTLDDGAPVVLALDAVGEAILVLRPGYQVETIAEIDLVAATGGNHNYDWSLAAVGPYAYVITSEGELFVVDVTPDLTMQDRLIGSIDGLGSSGDGPRLIRLEFDWGRPNGGVFVADSGRRRLWWIAWGIGDGRDNEISFHVSEP